MAAGNQLTPEEIAFYGERLVMLTCNAEALAREFLDWYADEVQHRQLTVEVGFDLWSQDTIEHGRPLLDSERGMLLFHVTHTPQRERRIRLARDGRPDAFTGAREHRTDPPGAVLDRIRSGDLRRQQGEASIDYVERLAVALGYMLRGGVNPVSRTMPEPYPHDRAAIEQQASGEEVLVEYVPAEEPDPLADDAGAPGGPAPTLEDPGDF